MLASGIGKTPFSIEDVDHRARSGLQPLLFTHQGELG